MMKKGGVFRVSYSSSNASLPSKKIHQKIHIRSADPFNKRSQIWRKYPLNKSGQIRLASPLNKRGQIWRKYPLNKSGQITVFIIIGILMLFAFSAFLYLTKTVSEERITDEGDPIIASVPQQFQPIQSYTENCLTQVAERGLLILGQQGGYINPELIGEFSAADPADADGIDLEPLKVPYWHYNSRPNLVNEISFSSLKPELYARDDPELSIESQLSRFVEENLAECIDDYAAFEEQGFVIEAPALLEESDLGKEVITTVADQTVNFLLEMDVRAELGGADVEMGQFFVKLPLRLKHYYEVASEITDTQTEHRFLELQALDLITAYSGVDVEKLPPTETITFSVVPDAFWSEAEVKNRVTGMLTSNVPMMRYLESNNFYRYEYSEEEGGALGLHNLFQKNYDNMILPLETAQNVEISFDYFGWEPFFDMNDKGGQIEPSVYSASFYLLQFNTNHYYATYDLSYPVLATIRDNDALHGQGFQFNFALESNIRNNVIPKEGYSQPSYRAAEQDSMVCDENKRNSEILRTVVVDSSTLDPLQEVQIGFSIPEQDDCVMGLTNSAGEFESSYPAIYGGVASFVKPEYLTNFYPIDTYEFRDNPGVIGYAVLGTSEQVIQLHKRKAVNVTVKKKSLHKCISDEDNNVDCYGQGLFGTNEGVVYSYIPSELEETHSWSFTNSAQSLDEQETAVIILNRKGDNNPEAFSDEFTAVASVRGTDRIEIQLVPGVYEVSGLLTDEGGIVIPREERCTGGLFSTCFDFQEQNLAKLLTGQVSWDVPETYLEITPEQLYGAGEITFYILSFDMESVPQQEHKRVIEDLQVMGELANISKDLQDSLQPSYN